MSTKRKARRKQGALQKEGAQASRALSCQELRTKLEGALGQVRIQASDLQQTRTALFRAAVARNNWQAEATRLHQELEALQSICDACPWLFRLLRKIADWRRK